MAFYKIKHSGTGLFLGVNNANNSRVENHHSVAMLADGSGRHLRWCIDSLGNNVAVKTMLNATFALNINTSNNNCDMNYIAGNEADTTVNIAPELDGTYRIKLTRTALYLTFDGTSVFWAAKTSGNSQKWMFTAVSETFPVVNHTYEQVSGHPNLHVITTHASNIKLVKLNGNTRMDQSGYCGVNGCFFDSDTLNVVVQDGAAVSNGRGYWNATGKGVIGWTGTEIESYDYIQSATSMCASGSKYAGVGTWLQGGIALHLGDSDWEAKILAQAHPDYPKEMETIQNLLYEDDEYRPRTAMVANMSTNQIKLFVHTSAVTVANFRSYIADYLGNELANCKAIMLDGGSSTGMVAKNSTGIAVAAMTNETNKKPIIQVVSLKNFN